MESRQLDIQPNKLVLTDEQMRCVINAGKKSLIIEGGAKTGKSLVLMKVYSELLKNVESCEEIGYFNSVLEFEQYINSIYKELVAYNEAPDRRFVDEKERMHIAEDVLNIHKAKFGRHRFHGIDVKLWLEEFDWIKGMNICHEEINDYLALDRSGRDNVIKMNAADKVIAFQIFSLYCQKQEENGQIDGLGQAMYLYRHKDLLVKVMKIKDILIDGGQNLTKVQASILAYLYKRTVVVTVNKPMTELEWDINDIGSGVEIRRLTICQELCNKVDEEDSRQKDKGKETILQEKRQPQERRKYTIDTSKARTGSLFRQLKEKEGTRIRLADGLNKEAEEKPKLDKGEFDRYIEEHKLSSYVEAFKMLRKCLITRNMDDRIKVIIERTQVLIDSIEKYNDVYQPDIDPFCEYYIPEVLRLLEKYLEHLEAEIKWKILHKNEMEILSALDELEVAINGKIDEIYTFTSIELEAQARAVESIMNQNGYVKSNYKI